MKYLKMGLFIALVGVETIPAEARTIYFGSETEVVPLVYGGPTILRFPGEIRTISQAQRFQIKPANADSPNYALLAVTPLFTTGSSEVATGIPPACPPARAIPRYRVTRPPSPTPSAG